MVHRGFCTARHGLCEGSAEVVGSAVGVTEQCAGGGWTNALVFTCSLWITEYIEM